MTTSFADEFITPMTTLSTRLFCVMVRVISAANTGWMLEKMQRIREKRKGSTEVRYLSVPVKFTWPSLSASASMALLYVRDNWIVPPQLPFDVAY